MLLQKQNLDNCLILILYVFSWLNLLQKLSSFTVKLSDVSCCITQKEFSAFISELCRSNVCLEWILVKFSKYMHQSSSNVVVNPNIIWCEYKNIVSHWTDLKVKNVVELIYLLGFLFQRRCSKLSYFLFANQTLWQLRYYLQTSRIDEILFAIDNLNGLESSEIPNSQIQLIVKR